MGIYLRSDSPYWHYSFKLPGRPQQKGSTGYEDKKLAEAKYIKIRSEAQQTKDFKKESKITITELLLWTNTNHWNYKNWEAEVRPLLSLLGSHRARELGTQTLLDYRAKRLEQGVAKSSINRELALLKAAFNYAIDCEKLFSNPVTKIEFFKCADNKRDKYANPDEKILLVNQSSGVMHDVIIFALATGMRLGEIVGLKWDNVDFNLQQIKVISRKGDQIIIRYVPMFRQSLEVLSALSKDTEYVFTDDFGRRLNESFVSHSFTRLVRATGVQGGDFRFHDLRHTFASVFLMTGKPLAALQRILGHTKADTTNRYAHLSKEYLQASIDSLPYVKYEQKVAQNVQKPSTFSTILEQLETGSLKNGENNA